MSRNWDNLPLNQHSWKFLSRWRDYMRAFEEAHDGETCLLPAPTCRQTRTASEILNRLQRQRGVILADDVGLGRTAVASLVACVVAGTRAGGAKLRVRILAPNAVLRRKWQSELRSHLAAAERCAPHLELERAALRVNRDIRKLLPGQIAVATHFSKGTLDCDLLIVDEAHRARNEHTEFGRRLGRAKGIRGLLILTATPFSLDVGELTHLLGLVGAGSETKSYTRRYGRLLGSLWEGHLGSDQ